MTTKQKQPATSLTPAQVVPDLSKALQQPEHSKVPGILTPPQPVLPSLNDRIEFKFFERTVSFQKTLGGGVVVCASTKKRELNVFIEQHEVEQLATFLTAKL